MTTTRSLLHALKAFLLSVLFVGGFVRAEAPKGIDCSATELLPPTVVAVAQASDLGSAIETILNHPLRRRIESLPAYSEIVKSGALEQVKLGVAGFETSMGKPWKVAIDTLTDGGITFALDSSTNGFAFLIKSSDIDMLERLQRFLLALGQMQQGKLSAIEQGDYRGFTAYALSKELRLVLLNQWMLITNKSDLGKLIIDQYIDRKKDSLHSSETFSIAVKEQGIHLQGSGPPLMSAYVDIAALRSAGIAKQLYSEKSDNPLAEVLLGGVIANLRHTPFLTVALAVNNSGAHLQLSSRHQRHWEPPREYFFGDQQLAVAPQLLKVENRLFAMSAHRDLSQMWLRSDDLLTDQANDGIAKADSQLTTFFSGRDFGGEILGALDSGVQIVGQSQDFTDTLPRPAIKLPAFAIQFRMKKPEETAPEFRRLFQSFIGFLNVVGAMDGQPQFDLDMETIDAAKLFTATYIAAPDKRESIDAPINYNFSPAIAFADDKVIFSSTVPLARELATLMESDPAETANLNTEFMFDASTLKQILNDNQSQLVANNMIEKGHDKQAADTEINLLLDLVGMFKDFKADLGVTAEKVVLNLRLNVAPE
jgi:hypothetical protein